MVPHRPSLRERLIFTGLLRPADPDEMAAALQSCSVYLQTVARTGVRTGLSVDRQLMLAALERWCTR